MKEASIVINGKILTEAEAMTVRVALESFSDSLNAEGLGEDNTGKEISELYKSNIVNIRKKTILR